MRSDYGGYQNFHPVQSRHGDHDYERNDCDDPCFLQHDRHTKHGHDDDYERSELRLVMRDYHDDRMKNGCDGCHFLLQQLHRAQNHCDDDDHGHD